MNSQGHCGNCRTYAKYMARVLNSSLIPVSEFAVKMKCDNK
jgi:hypothetical protein